MLYRTVTATLPPSPKEDVLILFSGGYDKLASYPQWVKELSPNDDNQISISLRVNDKDETPSLYTFIHPALGSIDFRLNAGEGEVDIEDLRVEGVIPHVATYETLTAYISSLNDSGVSQSYFIECLTLEVLEVGQKLFILPYNINPLTSQLFVNTLKAVLNQDYVVDSNMIRWLSDVKLDLEDEIELLAVSV